MSLTTKKQQDILNKNIQLLRCPINLTLFYDPVIARDGYTYERHCIEIHFKTKHTSPMTNEPIQTSLTSNFIMKQSIQNAIEINLDLQKEYEETKSLYVLFS